MVYRRIYYAKERETPKTHLKLRCEINTLFNTSFYGAQIWDLCITRGMWLFGKCSNYRLGHTDTSLKLCQKEGTLNSLF